MDGVVRRLPVKGVHASIDLIEIDGIFYLEAKGHDTLIRTKRFCLNVKQLNGQVVKWLKADVDHYFTN